MTKGCWKSYSTCVLLVILFVPAIACARTEEWVDEALLHDGRTVEVQRKVAFHFAGGELSQALTRWPDEYSRKIAFGCPARQGGEEKGLLPEAAPIL